MAVPTFKDLTGLLGKAMTVEAQQTIMALQEEHLSLREQNVRLREEINSLRTQLEFKQKISYVKPFYWIVDGVQKDGPYCQRCWDSDQKLIRLQEGYGYSNYSCLACHQSLQLIKDHMPYIPE